MQPLFPGSAAEPPKQHAPDAAEDPSGVGPRALSEAPSSPVEVRRSQRRKKTVSAYRDGETVVVLIPGRMSQRDERYWVQEMLRRLDRSAARERSPARRSDAELQRRCDALSRQYLQGKARPETVRWVATMRTRWASCTPAEKTIRVGERLRAAPSWVLDYVLVHELTHLLVAGHNAEFWSWVHRYPKAQRAIGYLEGLSAAQGWPIETSAPEEGA